MVKSVCFPGLAPSVCKFSSLIPDVSLLAHTKARSALARSIPMLPGGPAYLGVGNKCSTTPTPEQHGLQGIEDPAHLCKWAGTALRPEQLRPVRGGKQRTETMS